jgi:hypothetical protein
MVGRNCCNWKVVTSSMKKNIQRKERAHHLKAAGARTPRIMAHRVKHRLHRLSNQVPPSPCQKCALQIAERSVLA